MNVRQQLMAVIEQLSDEKLSPLLDLAILLKNKEKSYLLTESQAYQDWVSAENDIYDEFFADELTAR
ncbi:MAG: hypothetical protein KME17_11200 [Cyanosarcina radialis HA8281-LM2]|jgi:hypothetical protein|nr:hypothetical protein [Cyanosarcina radialis HA8281-LM2]